MAEIQTYTTEQLEQFLEMSRRQYAEHMAKIRERTIIDQDEYAYYISEKFGPDLVDKLTPFYKRLADAVSSKAGERLVSIGFNNWRKGSELDQIESVDMITINPEGNLTFDLRTPDSDLSIIGPENSIGSQFDITGKRQTLTSDESKVQIYNPTTLGIDNLLVQSGLEIRPNMRNTSMVLIGNEATRLGMGALGLTQLHNRMTESQSPQADDWLSGIR